MPGIAYRAPVASRVHLWSRYIAPVVLLMTSVLSTGSSAAEERTEPIRIGALTASWGPTPQMVGLRDGLVELRYRENEDFVIEDVALVTVLGPLALSQPAVTGLLERLNLFAYPPGTKPPKFCGSTVEGRRVSLAGLRGRVVLLTFWATWCSECRPEMPVFEQLHRDFVAEGLTVLGINVREGAPAIQTYAKELGLTFPLVLDPKGEIQASYGVVGLPTTFLIGRDGRGVALAVGPREWGSPPARAIIQALLAEPTLRKGAW